MGRAFTLQPDLHLLNKFNYDIVSSLEIEAIETEEKRVATELRFRILVEKYCIPEHYDTLLYICLIESNDADIKYQHAYSTYKQVKRVKELAQFLRVINPANKHKADKLKLTSLTMKAEIVDQSLINWIGKAIVAKLTVEPFSNIVLGEGIWELLEYNSPDPSANSLSLNFDAMEVIATKIIREPGKRERNIHLTSFLFNVWHFLDSETNLTTEDGVRFSAAQLNFLFDVAELFEWIKADNIESDPKDYIYTLLKNRINQLTN